MKNLSELKYEIEEVKRQANTRKKEALDQVQTEYTNIILNWFNGKEATTERDITRLLKDYMQDVQFIIKEHTI